ncbi:MAG: hypothetical protein WBB00_06420, partial [Mycobacterium sp.]
MVVTVGAPIYALGSDPVQLLSSVVITDVDSTTLSSATVTIATSAQDGDVLEYVAPEGNSIAGEWDAETKTLTLSGSGTPAEYREALKAVSFFTTDAGLPRGVLIHVTDDTDVTSPVPGVATIAVIGFPPLVVVSPVALGGTGSAVTVSPVVVITDLDSEELDSATVTLTDPTARDSFGWGPLPATVAATVTGGVLTFTGTASVAEYQALLESVTLTSATAGLKVVSFAVTDGAGNGSVVPAATVVTVVGLAVEVPPLLIVSPVAAGATGSAVTVSPIVVITDLDSEELDSATVTLTDPGVGDSFGWGSLPTNVAATVSGGVLTFTGSASVDEYRDLLASVTLTSATAGLKVVGFAVTDGDGNASVVPAATVVTVVGLAVEVPPLVIVSPVAAGAAGSPVTVSPIVLITDLDSTEIDSATVTLTDPGVGDSLGWGDVPAGVTAGLVGGV